MGIAHLEIFEMENAVEDLKKALALDGNDPTSHFFLSVAYLFMDNPQAEEHMRKARSLDEKKTKQLLRNFYTLFIKDDPAATDAQKRKMDEAIRTLESRQQ
jgi:Tfp pilus assembly protein PilF